MQTISCTLRLNALPRFVKPCPRCGHPYFENSGCFRINANGKLLDIRLVCRCENCKTIWNLTVCKRKDRKLLDPQAYREYLENDENRVLLHVFDPAFLANNRATLDLDHLDFCICGESPREREAAQVTFSSAYLLPLPAGDVAARILGVSRSRVRRMHEAGTLAFSGDLRQTKTAFGFRFILAEGWQRTEQ
ncbi:MAG: DUF1062 domain-containing protein [Clostridiales bacterium]|nr:DUF1062 domain-containing protein [Clostridiales bacterium]